MFLYFFLHEHSLFWITNVKVFLKYTVRSPLFKPTSTFPLQSFIRMLLMVMSIIRCIFTIVHFHLICNFVNSKPPGRKMVWNTIENFQICLDVLVNWCTLLATLLLSSSRSHSRSHPRSRSRSWSVHGQYMVRSWTGQTLTPTLPPKWDLSYTLKLVFTAT